MGKKKVFVFVFGRSGMYYENDELDKNNPIFYYYRRHLVCNTLHSDVTLNVYNAFLPKDK